MNNSMPTPCEAKNKDVLLDIRELKTHFNFPGNVVLHAVDGVNLSIGTNEVVGLVGESGCGKTVFSLSILRLIDAHNKHLEGKVIWQGKDLLQFDEDDIRKVRGKEIAMIFQNAQSALNPVFSIGAQLVSVIRLHHKMSKHEAQEKAMELLRQVGIPDAKKRLNDYPHQFSGGMCQRILIAMALSCNPKLLIADEPTASLDVTIQAQILELLKSIRQSRDMSILLISHDLGVIAEMCDRVAVMYLGRIVEIGSARDIYHNPLHPYTQALIQSVPSPNPDKRNEYKALGGELPSPVNLPKGCKFQTRCPKVQDRCLKEDPVLRGNGNNSHFVACFLYENN